MASKNNHLAQKLSSFFVLSAQRESKLEKTAQLFLTSAQIRVTPYRMDGHNSYVSGPLQTPGGGGRFKTEIEVIKKRD